MQMTEDLIRNVVQEVLTQMGNGAIADQRQGGRPVRREPRRLPDRRRRRRGGRGGLRAVPHAAAWPTARRPSTASARSASSRPRSWAGRARGDQDRPARPQDRQAPDDDPADPGRRVPADRQRQRRQRAHAHRLHPVRRHRRDHAGHAQPADAGGQRDQHAGRGQHGRLQRPPVGRRRSPPRASAGSTRRSARRSASTT